MAERRLKQAPLLQKLDNYREKLTFCITQYGATCTYIREIIATIVEYVLCLGSACISDALQLVCSWIWEVWGIVVSGWWVGVAITNCREKCLCNNFIKNTVEAPSNLATLGTNQSVLTS